MDLRTLLNSTGSIGNAMNSFKSLLEQNIPSGTTRPQTSPAPNTNDAFAEMSLLFETLFNVLLDKGVITQDEFQRKFDQLDMLDGTKDGKKR